MGEASAITDAKITEMWKGGMYPKEIGEALGIESDQVMERLAELELPSPDQRPAGRRTRWTSERKAEFAKMWGAGTHVDIIANHFGTSRGAVYARVTEMDLPRRPRGKRPGRQPTKLRPSAKDGQRRFKPTLPGEQKKRQVELRPEHPALRLGSTIYGRSVIPASHMDRLLKSGEHNVKIGRMSIKGRWKNMPIFTLTLEERATCPRSCKVWDRCYGNNMGQTNRIHDDGWLKTKLFLEMVLLAQEYPGGFIVRLHVLGDFIDLDYVKFWSDALTIIPQLRIFGFTAHLSSSDIGRALVELMRDNLDQVALRWSGWRGELHGSEVITNEADAIGIVCPAQKDADRSCATCGLCWNSERTISFLEH